MKIKHAWPVVWMMLIFWFSHRPGDESSLQSGWVLSFLASMGLPIEKVSPEILSLLIRKTAHFTEYMVLSLLWLRADWGIYRTLALILIYAALDEFHQSFIPGRAASVVDVGVDFAGGLMGCLGYFFQKNLK